MAQQKFNAVAGFSVNEFTYDIGGNVLTSPIDVVDSNANVYANNLFVSTHANLGNIGNIYIGGGLNNQVLKTDGTGNLYWALDSAPAGGNTTEVQFNTGGSLDGSSGFTFNKISNALTINGNITTVNASLGNLATANYFSGNGSLLSSVTGANVTGQVGNALVAGTVYSNAQPNITSLGTLSSLQISGTGNVYGANVVSANYLTGTLTTQAQPNITSVGTLTTLDVSGNLTSGNANLGNAVSANYFVGNGSLLTGTVGNANYAAYAGNVVGASQPNITSVGALSSLTVTGLTTATGGVKTANILDTTGTITIQTRYNTNPGDVGITSNLTVGSSGTGNLTVNGISDLGPIGNVKISGGASNYVLITNGSGTLSWASQIPNALVAGTVYNNAQPNITSVGTLAALSVNGDAVIGGNLSIEGNVTYTNVDSLVIQDPIIEQGGGPNGNPLTFNDGKDRGSLLHYYTTKPVDAFMGWDNSNAEFGFGSNVSVSGEIVTWNQYSNVRADYFLGNGSQLTGVIGNANYAAYAGNVTNAQQPNITSLGTLSGLNVTGDSVFTGNVTINGANANLSVTSLVVQDNVIDISAETLGTPSNNAGLRVIRGDEPSVQLRWTESLANWQFTNDGFTYYSIVGKDSVGNVSVGNLSATNLGGNLITAAQPNITSVGTLNGVTVTGIANLIGTTNVSLGDVNNVHISGGTTGYILRTDGAGTLTWVSPSSAGIAGTNTQVQFNDNGSFGASANFTFNKTSNTISTDNITLASGNLSGANLVSANYLTGTLTTKAQPNITSVGNLVNANIDGNLLVGGNLTVNGAVEYTNVTNLYVQDPIIEMGGNSNGGTLTSNDGKDRGTLLHYYTTKPVDAFMGWDNSNGEFALGSNVSLANEVATFNTYGNLRVGNVFGTGLQVSGNITAGNASLGNLVTANYFSGDGTYLTNLPAGIQVVNGTSNVKIGTSGGNVTVGINGTNNVLVIGSSATTITGNFQVSGNITRDSKNVPTYVSATSAPSSPRIGDQWYDQVNDITYQYIYDGTNYYWVDISSGYVSANTQAVVNTLALRDGNANLYANYFIGNGLTISGVSTLGANGNVKITGGTSGQYLQTDGTGNLTWTSITATGSYISNGTSNVNAGTLNGNITVSIAGTSNTVVFTSTGVNVAGYINTGTGNITSGNAALGNLVTANYVTGTLTTQAQPNITSTGTLNGLTANGVVNFTGSSNVSLGPVGNVKITGGTSGYVLKTDGAGNLSWAADSTNPAGSNTQIQFNDGGTSLGASAAFVFNKGTNTVTVTGNVTTNNANLGNLATANFFSGNGSLLTGLNATSLISGTISSTILGNSTHYIGTTAIALNRGSGAQSLTGITSIDGYANTVSYATQSNITSVGTLNGLTATATVNFIGSSNVSLGPVGNVKITGGTSGYVLKTDGTGNLSWGADSTNPAGSNTQIQFNDGGSSLGASAAFTFDKGSNALTLTGNITTNNANLGNLATANYINVSSNLTVNGTLYANAIVGPTTSNVTITAGTFVSTFDDTGNITLAGNVSTTANVSAGNVKTNNLLYANGVPWTFSNYSNTNVGAYLTTYTGNISANYYTGNGSQLTSITGSNVTGQVSNALVAGTVYTNAQPNITSLGTLSSLDVSGNISTGSYILGNGAYLTGLPASYSNANVAAYLPTYTGNFTAGNVSVTGNITAAYFIGNGSQLTGLPAGYANANVEAFLPTYTGNLSAGNVFVNNLGFGQIAISGTSSQLVGGPDLLWEFSNAALWTTRIKSNGYITTTGNVTSGNAILGNLATANYFEGTLTTQVQPNITSLGTLSGLTVSGLTDLGSVNDVTITGGGAGYVLATDGTGNLTWTSVGTTLPGLVAIVKDRFLTTGSANTFTLTTTPASQNLIEVVIDGLQQISNTYTLTGAVLSFPTNPAAGQVIEVTSYGGVDLTGNVGEVQFNAGGSFGSSNTFTFNTGTNTLSVTNLTATGNLTSQGGYIYVDNALIAVSGGTAGIFNTSVSNVNIGMNSNITLGSTLGNVSARGTFSANNATINNLSVGDYYSGRSAVIVTTDTIIDQFAVNIYRSAKYTMRINSDAGYQAVEVLLVHDGSSSFVTIYGSISSIGTDIVSLTSSIVSGNVQLRATTTSTNTTVKILGTYVPD